MTLFSLSQINDTPSSVSIHNVMFPVVYSTLSIEALVERVLSQYELFSILSCQFWNRGLSDVYLIETPLERYVLRISHTHWRSRSDIGFELELLDFLQRQHIPVAYPLRTKTDQLWIELDAPEGKRYAALFIYAPGQIALGDLNETQGYKLGEVVAQLHDATRSFKSLYPRQALTLDYLLDESVKQITPFLRHHDRDLAYLLNVVDQAKQQLQDLPQVDPYWVVCWGDPHSGNAHFTTDNTVTLFDFDQCGYGWRAFEIAKFLQISIRSGISRKIREAFLRGYQTIQPLTTFELASLKALTQTAHIWCWAINLGSAMLHHYSQLDDYYFRHRLEQLKRLESKDWQLF
jgi:Ser/Thr protein kinase RdoA (MazF antagonist)